jgi:hypothetical protein
MVLARRLQVLPDRQEIDIAERRSSMSWSTSLRSSPSPTMIPDFVKIVGSSSLTRCSSRIEWK